MREQRGNLLEEGERGFGHAEAPHSMYFEYIEAWSEGDWSEGIARVIRQLYLCKPWCRQVEGIKAELVQRK